MEPDDFLLFLPGEFCQEPCRDEWFDCRCNKQKSLHPKKDLALRSKVPHHPIMSKNDQSLRSTVSGR